LAKLRRQPLSWLEPRRQALGAEHCRLGGGDGGLCLFHRRWRHGEAGIGGLYGQLARGYFRREACGAIAVLARGVRDAGR
jgi:hypothetical protein